MAERRMFAKSIVLSDAFLDMPLSARCLYFTLGMLADDDGFVGNPKSIMRQCGASMDDMNVLLSKRYLLSFDSGVMVIKHWRMNNYLRNDRYHTTTYLEEKEQLRIDERGAYTEKPENTALLESGIPSGRQVVDKRYTEVRLGKVRLGNNNIYCREKEPDREENQIVKQVIDYLNEVTGSRYTCKNKTTNSNIKARVSEGHTLEDFKTVIDKKNAQWGKDPKMSKFLRPETLFCSKHFESYLNERITTNDTTRGTRTNGVSDEERDRQVDEILEHLNDDTDDIWD